MTGIEREICAIWRDGTHLGDWFRVFDRLSSIATILVEVDIDLIYGIAGDFHDLAMVAAKRHEMAMEERLAEARATA